MKWLWSGWKPKSDTVGHHVPFNWPFVLGHRQVTDMYLLALAFYHGGRLVTFDRSIMIEAVGGAESHNLVVLT
jgi:uncharacterized protein